MVLELFTWVSVPALPFTKWVTLNNVLDFFMTLFLHLWNGYQGRTCPSASIKKMHGWREDPVGLSFPDTLTHTVLPNSSPAISYFANTSE